ncbi:Radical SAM superfamily enzyme, MoaA/NifB/PqqE/SkfB family [Thermanaeromonas toyohensis ToBE]|uniref:Radical SAM superfamily enzyme, MoaA/NifB/PqqE/SkfB family n=1 Tax=Thermanaeromonas toyohensis ToBE TaxID=698762 RepID=A0A1W1VV34_9FIRM|nr:radical SAM protein [Thermanaeromonas toyohensis]SMB96961.1 Radical SAM superfamily enzyme, MoaA/NifB/PqqE/SkfB family [Thermanaeromonas toyohensis ToBE]
MPLRLNLEFAKRFVGEKLLEQVLNYLEGDPKANIPRFLQVLELLTRDPNYKEQIRKLKEVYENDAVVHEYLNKMFSEIDRGMRHKMVCNVVVNSLLVGAARRQQVKEKEGIHIPFTILIDPTSACNLKCTGCWAGEYAKHDQLEPELFDRIIREAKELGIYTFVLSGGEPLLYPHLFELAEKHNDVAFMMYTNGTRITDEVAERLQELGNISPAISLEGFEELTDARRGKGVFGKICAAMDRLQERGVLFGASVTVTKDNIEEVASEAFIEFLITKGVKYLWSFHYIPIGRDPDVSLMITPEQRAWLYKRFRYLRTHKPIQIIDFWNDGELTCGCIAGGKSYFHINARGDVEPCAFVHFAVDNIREKSLKEVLSSPLFMAYQKRQPFSENYLRPCPVIDVPEALRDIVRETGARPTHPGADTVLGGEIGSFLDQRSSEWKRVSDKVWVHRTSTKAPN